MNKKYWPFFVSFFLIGTFAFLLGQNPSDRAYSASPMVDDIIVMPRNYMFTWGSSGQGIWVNNTVYCSANPDHTKVIYWRTNDTNSSAGVNDWNPNVIVAGHYDIYAFIPNYTHNANITTRARYYFNGSLLATIDQNQGKCNPNVPGSGWVLLGRRLLNAGTSDTISMPAQTSDNPYRLIAGDGLKLVYVPSSPTPTPPSGPIVFSGNPSSRLFFDNNGERINLEVCANNLSGQTVRAQLSRPGHTYNIVSQQATNRCVIFWDMDGPGTVLFNTNYTTRAALNQNPNPNWPVPCYTATGGQGLCDTNRLLGGGSSAGYKLPYTGGESYLLSRIDHNTNSPGIQNPAYDFVLPINRRVVAARPGRVIQVVQHNTLFACNRSYQIYANFIAIQHPDNQVSYYVHLRQNGATVQPGNQVQRGQLIGYTGRSGFMCGDHLHFAVLNRPGGHRLLIPFEDTGGVVPTVGQYHISGNYLGSLTQNHQSGENSLPEGLVQFHLTLAPSSNEVKLLAYDYLQDVTEMRVTSNEASLPGAAWIPFTNTLIWSEPSIFVQYRTPDGRISAIYSDTIAATASDPIAVSFELESAQVCVGENVNILNFTVPYCPQCSWEWNLGNGTTTQSFNPSSDLDQAWWEERGAYGLNLSYSMPGTYTISASATNASYANSTSRQVTVVEGISANFTVVRTGNNVTVSSVANNAVYWEWDFGDGTVATGQTANHTYAHLDVPWVITLTTHAANGCTSESWQVVQNYHIFLPFFKR